MEVQFLPLPPEGLSRETITKLAQNEFWLWGIVPLAGSGIILPDGSQGQGPHLVVVRDRHNLPLPVLARMIVAAKLGGKGLNGLVQSIFGFGLPELMRQVKNGR